MFGSNMILVSHWKITYFVNAKIKPEPYLFSTPKMMDEYFNVASCMELYLLSPACIIMRAQCMYMLVKTES